MTAATTAATSAAATTPMRPDVSAAVDRFVAFLETGASDGLLADDLFADITLPHWRVQTSGAADFLALKNRLHPPSGRTRVEKVLAGDEGYTIKVEERWQDDGRWWYCREAFLCDLDAEGRIVELSVYCTGDWSEDLVAEHAGAVTLLRP